MAARTKARKRALDVLFEADQRGENVLAALDRRVLDSGRETPLPSYSIEIVRGVVAWWPELNSIIQSASPEWQLSRMPAVDRALLRIAAWEVLCNDSVDTAVAIDEAVSLAADLSTDESPSFVNGVLGTIAREAPVLRHDA
ncbi:transcription antitermination factor NusB [Demequina silvatica]|uniref:transcription antitermination factor NusB n=1 Tax=Demequina silvatica TaxID=1638988 RepID=UPI000783949F|nr:transcription antitermination factor NusB [Demequina silvatica]